MQKMKICPECGGAGKVKDVEPETDCGRCVEVHTRSHESPCRECWLEELETGVRFPRFEAA